MKVNAKSLMQLFEVVFWLNWYGTYKKLADIKKFSEKVIGGDKHLDNKRYNVL